MPGQRADSIHRAISSLQRLTDVFRERRQQLAAEMDLSESQWRVLEEIDGEGFMPSMFARRRDCTPAAVSRTLRQLLQRRLVSVAISEGDARQRIYRLTTGGRNALRRLGRSRQRAIAATWDQFSETEVEQFTHFAETLSAELETYARKPRRD